MFTKSALSEPYKILKERLAGTNTDLITFYFHRGANVYVFSYDKEGVKKHTFIDAGDSRYRNQILSILVENDVDPTNIERIIITHSHADHCGSAYILARESGAKILVHSNFKSFIEGEVSQDEQRSLSDFHLSRLKGCDIEYLSQSNNSELIDIGGVDFPSLVKPIEMDEVGKLQILACPEHKTTHSLDQIIALYSPKGNSYMYNETHDGFKLTDNILFSGDLWLMEGPLYRQGIWRTYRRLRNAFRQIKYLVKGKGILRRDFRKQDAQAKGALKRGFRLIRVKPAHGEEFIGSSIIPGSLLADSDLLQRLGYSIDADKSLLRSADLAPKISTIRQKAYADFIKELLTWTELGYTLAEISGLLVRIYKEQSGGGLLVKQDRRDRRERLKATLGLLRDDQAKPDELRQLAESTLAALKGIS